MGHESLARMQLKAQWKSEETEEWLDASPTKCDTKMCTTPLLHRAGICRFGRASPKLCRKGEKRPTRAKISTKKPKMKEKRIIHLCPLLYSTCGWLSCSVPLTYVSSLVVYLKSKKKPIECVYVFVFFTIQFCSFL